MTDAYEILGVSRSATDEEIKNAYRALAKKFHPDNFADAPDIAAVADEKMRDINEAYDRIMKERKGGAGAGSSSNAGSSNPGASYSSSSKPGYSGGATYSGTGNNAYSTSTSFPDVRRLILNDSFDDANAVLDGVPTDRRDAEWNFLKGVVLYRRGWLEQSFTYLQAAVNMDPGNAEFRAAYNQANNMRSGNSGGYRMSGRERGGCDPCNMCCSLLCADQCCECCGGDLISCC